jgi:proline iminopeptidase
MRINVNGVSLFFDVEGLKLEQQGTELRERPTLVALHGGPGVDHAMYRPMLSALTGAAQVVYLDLRGNGRSDVSSPEHWNLATWADDVRAFCDALEIRKPVVLGTSFGGFVAQAYATRYPDHPGKLILCSTNARFNLERTVAMFEKRGGPEAGAVARQFLTDPSPAVFMRYLQVCHPYYTHLPVKQPSPASIIQLAVAQHFIGGEWHTFDFSRELEKVRCPTLVLAGKHDPILPFQGSEELVAQLKPELTRFEAFPDCAHDLLAERPERAMGLISEFLRS